MQYNLVKLNTARNALRYVIRSFKIKEIYLPYYICPALRNAINKENCKIIYYHIDKNFRPLQPFPKNAFLIYPNYFGICGEIVEELSQLYPNLIVDNAHSFYSEPKGIASFNSLRKFFPILRDGSFLYIKSVLNVEFEKDNYSYEPMLLNYKEICLNEKRLDSQDIKCISDSTLKLFYNIDIEKEKQKRIKKFNYWQKKLNGNVFLNNIDIPYAYPYLCQTQKQANELVNELKGEDVTIYRYWNNLPCSFPERIFYTNLVSIPLC